MQNLRSMKCSYIMEGVCAILSSFRAQKANKNLVLYVSQHPAALRKVSNGLNAGSIKESGCCWCSAAHCMGRFCADGMTATEARFCACSNRFLPCSFRTFQQTVRFDEQKSRRACG